MESQNAYSVLGLRKGADDAAVKEAYVELVKRFDPEKHTDRFMVVQNAYERLRNPAKRAREDVLTFNHVAGSFHFTSEEKTDAADAQVNQEIQDLERRFGADGANDAARNALVKGLMKRSYKKAARHLWAEAIEDWRKILELDATHQRAKNNMLHSLVALGYSYAEHELYDEAIDLWEKALQMNPEDERLLHNLAIACEFSGRERQAQRYWSEVLKRWQKRLDADPEDAYTQNCIIELRRHHGGRVGEREEGKPQSIEDYREILKLNPNDFEAQYKIATAMMEEQNWTEAVRALAKITQQYPKNIEVLNMLGWAYLNGGQIERAFQAWNRALAVDPKNHSTREAIIKARMSMGRAFRNKGMHTQSLVHFKALLRLTPNSPEVLSEIGQTYMLKGDKRSAAKAFFQVLKLDPQNKTVRQFLSDMKLRT